MSAIMEACFLNTLHSEELSDDDFKVIEPLRYYSKILDRITEIPVSFESDGCSVPRLPIAYWLCGGTAKRPGTLHDFFYREKNQPNRPDRETADKVFLEALESVGVGWVKRHSMYYVVRSFGWMYYQK